MSKDIRKSIVNNVKEFLQIDEECSASELYTRLREFRNSLHPDRYNEESAQKLAEKKFKQANEMLSELISIHSR